MDEQKKRYLVNHVSAITQLVAAIQAVRSIRQVYDARGYDTGGTLTDADLAAAGFGHLTAQQYRDALAAIEGIWSAQVTQAGYVAMIKIVP